MPCRCATSTLAIFVRRIARINLESTIIQTRRRKPFSTIKRDITSLRLIKFQRTTRPTQPEVASSNSVSSGQLPLYGKPSKETRTIPTHISPTGRFNENNLTTSNAGQDPAFSTAELYPRLPASNPSREKVQQDAADLEASPSILEITSEVIDRLATESLGCSLSATASIYRSSLELNATLAKPSPIESPEYNNPRSVPSKTVRKIHSNETQSVAGRSSSSIVDGQIDRLVTERLPWQIQKAALKEKFKDGWNPRKKLSPDALTGIRAIHEQFPEQYTTRVLAEKFEVSPEAIRRILKSHWAPKEGEVLDRQRRWFSRGKKVWSRYAELGVKPPARWRTLGIGKRDASIADRHYRRSNERTTLGIRDDERASQDSDEGFRSGSLAEQIL